jgi:hypothetical protein
MERHVADGRIAVSRQAKDNQPATSDRCPLQAKEYRSNIQISRGASMGYVVA